MKCECGHEDTIHTGECCFVIDEDPLSAGGTKKTYCPCKRYVAKQGLEGIPSPANGTKFVPPQEQTSRAQQVPCHESKHKFDPIVFQGREQLACQICGYTDGAAIHQVGLTTVRGEQIVAEERQRRERVVKHADDTKTVTAIPPHYHQAKYDHNNELMRECEECDKDLMHESHIREERRWEPTCAPSQQPPHRGCSGPCCLPQLYQPGGPKHVLTEEQKTKIIEEGRQAGCVVTINDTPLYDTHFAPYYGRVMPRQNVPITVPLFVNKDGATDLVVGRIPLPGEGWEVAIRSIRTMLRARLNGEAIGGDKEIMELIDRIVAKEAAEVVWGSKAAARPPNQDAVLNEGFWNLEAWYGL